MLVPLFIFLLSFSSAYACELTFSELLDTGLQNHPKTKQAWARAKRAGSILGSAKAGYYPEVELNTSAIHGRDFKYINGPDTNYTMIRADLALSMILYDFGERDAKVLSSKMALIAAGWDVDFTMQQVIVEILENAYRLVHEEEAYQADALSLEDAKKMLEISEKLFHSGLNPVSDVYISRSALSLMQIETTRRKSLLDIQRGRLAASLNVPLDTPLTLLPIPVPSFEQQPEIEALLAIAETQRGDLLQKRARIVESAAHLSQVNAAYKPKLSLGGRGGYDQAFKDKSNGAHYQVVLNLDVPLFNGFKSFYQNQEAYANLVLREEEARDLELDIALEVLTFSRKLEAANEMLKFADENLQNAKKAYEGTLDKYEVGEENIADLSMAQKELARARILYSDIKTELLVSIANLAFATGTLCTN